MMHAKRIWTLAPVASAEELAAKLTGFGWCLCSGFFVDGHEDLLFLNDSTSEDGAQEYAAVRREAEGCFQVESVTFGWMTRERALDVIRALLAGTPVPEEPTRLVCRLPVGAWTPPMQRGGVTVAQSVAEVREALGACGGAGSGEDARDAMHVRVEPRIESAEEHRGRACCA